MMADEAPTPAPQGGALTSLPHARAIVSILVLKLGGKITLTPADYASIEGSTLQENVQPVDPKIGSFDLAFELHMPVRNLQ